MTGSSRFAGLDWKGDLDRRQVQVMTQPQQTEQEVRALLTQWEDQPLPQEEALERRAYALMTLAASLFYQGKFQEQQDMARAALEASRLGQLPRLEARALCSLGLTFQRSGDFEQALPLFLQSLQVAEGAGDQEGRARALTNLGLIHYQVGHFEQSLALHQQALAEARACLHTGIVADSLYSLAEDYLALGRQEEALQWAEQALAFARSHGLVRYECACYVLLSQLLLKLNEPDNSLQLSLTGQRVAQQAGDQDEWTKLRRQEGEARMALGELEQAEVCLQESLSRSVQNKNHDYQVASHASLAALYRLLGRDDRAASHLHAEIELLKNLHSSLVTQSAQVLSAYFSPVIDVSSHLSAKRLADDPLTGLSNRHTFLKRLQNALELRRPEELIGLVVMNLDHLSSVNDRHGQKFGDDLLMQVAERLRRTARPAELLGRVSGDEFVLRVRDLEGAAHLTNIMEKLLGVLREPFQVRGRTLHLTASLGGALAPQDGQEADTLFRHAQLAMQQVKAHGRNGTQVFHANLHSPQDFLRVDLLHALQRQEFCLHYQAQFDLKSRQLCGLEALVRWQHPELGLLLPGKFIALAEKHGVILPLGHWVLDEACRQAAEWRLAERGLHVAVNVSALQFEQPDFVQEVQSLLEKHGVPGRVLVIELTESMLYRNEPLAVQHVTQLQALGVQISLDDFGTGFSSLGVLQSLPFRELKIDRAFMPDATLHATQLARVRTLLEVVVNLAHTLGMRVVAEGVEREDQFALLQELNGDVAQGFLLAHPVAAQDIESLLPALR